MYSPAAFASKDLAQLDALAAANSFATLITIDNGAPFISHLPVLYSRNGDQVLIRGHWARVNPQARHSGSATLVLHGPDAYISPSWYADKEAAARVPTWNYAVAHLTGKLETSEDETVLATLVSELSVLHETGVGSDWRFDASREGMRRQLRGITGFAMRPDRIELKLKLSQNHPPANVTGAAGALDALPAPRAPAAAVAALMRQHLELRAALQA